jgi:hypothetical protein
VLHKVVVSCLVLGLLAPRLSAADDSSGLAQAAPAPAPKARPGHPYKKPGLIIMGIGGLLSVAAMLGTAGVEGVSFRECQAAASQRGVSDDCRGALGTSPSLAGLGVGLIGAGALIALHRPARTPHITIGRGRWFVSHGISF